MTTKFYDLVEVKVPESALDDLDKILHKAGLCLFRGENPRIKYIPDFIRKKEVLQGE